MTRIGTRWLAAAVVVSCALLCTGVGIALSTADDPKGPDLSELRDTIKAASKRGENVDEIRKAFEALEKALAKGWTAPKPGDKVAATPELTALRDAVEMAGKKGENVEEIRKQLEAVELVMTGKTFTRPKPPPPVDPPVRPVPPNPLDFPPQAFPNFNGGLGGIDRELLQKSQELRMKALETLLKAPNDADAAKLMQEAQELMLKAMGNRGLGNINPGLMLPDFGRAQDRFRLGIRMERIAPITAEQLGLDNQGVAITSVIPGSAADKAGFKVHDIVVEFAGKAISDNPDDLSGRVTEAKAGVKVDAVVVRKGKKVEIKGIELPDVPQIANPRLPNFQNFPNLQPMPNLQPLPLPVPDLKLPDRQPRPGGVRPGAGPVPPPNPLGRNAVDGDNSSSISVVNGQFTIKTSQAGVKYVVTGAMGDDGPAVETIAVTDGDKTHEAKKLDELPKEYQPMVERLLKGVQGRVRR